MVETRVACGTFGHDREIAPAGAEKGTGDPRRDGSVVREPAGDAHARRSVDDAPRRRQAFTPRIWCVISRGIAYERFSPVRTEEHLYLVRDSLGLGRANE